MISITLACGMIWFYHIMNEQNLSFYMLELLPSLTILLTSIPTLILSADEKLVLAEKAFWLKDPLVMDGKIPRWILFVYFIFIIYNLQKKISMKINIRKVYAEFKLNGYRFNTIIAIYAGLIITLLFSAIHMLITIMSKRVQSDAFYLFLPGTWFILTIFMQIFENLSSLKVFNKKYGKEPVGYSKSQLNKIDIASLEIRLESLMQEKKLYRNENLTLQKLARHLDLSTQQLSEYLNVTKQTGYREYISQYRIEEAKKILLEKPEMNASLVGFEVGFPSVSGFYKIFKKKVGISPADFRKSIQPG
ncbi:MAG: helix-turn-helix domain-containing protein [Spirochaetia bacterium]|nr:helix-turn-helix domain-containing protein [Spirochaetia bacterium]